MPVRTTPLERAVEALRHLPVGDLAAREHVRTVRSSLAVASDGELLRFLRLLDALDVDVPRAEIDLDAARAAVEPMARRVALARLRRHLEPARDGLLRHLAAPPGDLRLVVELRAQL